ncbi:unnamed protein product, partial [Symbiodinium sp. KB8]
MRLCNADVDEAERNYQEEEEDFEEMDNEEGISVGKVFFDLRQRTLSGMDQMPAFRVVVLGLLRKLRNNVKDSILYSEVEDALGRYFRVLDADMQRFANLHEILRDSADKAATQAPSREAAGAAVFATHTAGTTLLHEAMREIAVVLLACGEMQRRSLDLKLQTQRSISASSGGAPLISYSRFADFLDEATALCVQLRRKHEELQQQRIRAMATLTEAKLATEADPSKCVSSPEEADAAQARYEQLLKTGSAVDQRKREDWYDRLAWWTDVKTKSGARVFVLAPRGPRGETEYGINMHELLAYALSKMHRVVAEEDTRFAVVWVQLSDHRVGPWQCFRFAESLHERYAANLEAIHVVHPSWTTRIL